jgi:hypothetical protein
VTIYGVGYRSLQYEPTPMLARLRAVADVEFRTLFRGKWGVAVFFLCLGPSIVSFVAMLVQLGILQFGPPRAAEALQENMPQQPELLRFVPSSIHFYLRPVLVESLAPFLILSALVSSRAIAKDVSVNALELYWTRGITPRGYFLAKWAGSFALLAILCIGAPFVLWVSGAFLAPDWTLLETTAKFMPRALLGLLVFTLVLSWMPVAFSAIAGTPNLASVFWVMLLIGSTSLGNLVAALLDSPSWAPVLSVWDSAGTLAGTIAGLPGASDQVQGALLNLTFVVLALTWLASRRMRMREAVA